MINMAGIIEILGAKKFIKVNKSLLSFLHEAILI